MPDNIIMADAKGGVDYLAQRISNTLESYTIPADVTTIRNHAFFTCTELKSVDFPQSVTLINQIGSTSGNTFEQTGLETVHLHNASIAGDNHFRSCTSLRIFVGENITLVGMRSYYLLYSCKNLETFDANIPKLDQAIFGNCAKLDKLILRKTDGITACNAASFDGTPFTSGGTGGTIYIPKAFYDHLGDGTSLDYKAASGWSTIDGYGTITWAQIEGSIYETQYADGTPIPTGG